MEEEKEKSEFKLLAIRPLKGCNARFLKNLHVGAIYKFYQDYSFLDEDGIEIEEKNNNLEAEKVKVVIPKENLDLYSPKDSKLKINISAVVGKNGSGKSTLIELLFAAAYVLAVDQEILDHTIPKNDKKKGVYKAQLKTKERIEEIKKEINEDCVERIANESYSKLKKRISQLNWNEDHLEYLEGLEQEIPKIKKELKVAIYYQIGNEVIELRIDGKAKSELIDINGHRNLIVHNEADKKFANDFFYSLVLNYSQYALNSREVGVWIKELFHKNDAYQTPIVINPMRTNGNYDINTENKLARQRLLANILEPIGDLRQLAKGRLATRIKLTLNIEKFKDESGEVVKELTDYELANWDSVVEIYEINELTREPTDLDIYAKKYIFKKMKSMAEKYTLYNHFLKDNKFSNFKAYLNALKADKSHIVYKFHQTINFLKYNYAHELIVNVENTENEFNSVGDLSKSLNKHKKDAELIHVIPPSIFNAEVYFDEKNDDYFLGRLSSGEKQYVYSISSIMYHLRYLDSVKQAEYEKDEKGKRKKVEEGVGHKYKYVNLIFDEVELYYHPELQRTFINDLLEAINRCNLRDIKSINCIFITHSPFILSDIPSSNILKLKKGELIVNNQLTFGANIHDLLANDFFLKEGFMGSFANGKINSTIKWLNAQKRLKDRGELDIKADSFISEKIKHKKIIEFIGENILRVKLTEMLSELNEDDTEFEEMIKNEIHRLNSLIQN